MFLTLFEFCNISNSPSDGDDISVFSNRLTVRTYPTELVVGINQSECGLVRLARFDTSFNEASDLTAVIGMIEVDCFLLC